MLCIYLLPRQFSLQSVNLFVHHLSLSAGFICCSAITTFNKCTLKWMVGAPVPLWGWLHLLSQSGLWQFWAWSRQEWMQTCLSPPQGWKQEITRKCLAVAQASPNRTAIRTAYTHCQPTASCPMACFLRRHDIPQKVFPAFPEPCHFESTEQWGNADAARSVKITAFL